MSTKDVLLQRPDIPDECVQELVERAATFQERDRSQPGGASESDILRVAEELDIEQQYVEQAIAEWRSAQIETGAQSTKTKIRKRGKTMMKVFIAGSVMTVAAFIAAAATSFVAFGWAGVAGITAAIVAILVWIAS